MPVYALPFLHKKSILPLQIEKIEDCKKTVGIRENRKMVWSTTTLMKSLNASVQIDIVQIYELLLDIKDDTEGKLRLTFCK